MNKVPMCCGLDVVIIDVLLKVVFVDVVNNGEGGIGGCEVDVGGVGGVEVVVDDVGEEFGVGDDDEKWVHVMLELGCVVVSGVRKEFSFIKINMSTCDNFVSARII
nr:hypothetical protein [Tanacetum cinerariifolium]